MRAIAFMRAERVGHGGQRHLHIGLKVFRVRHGRRHLAHAIHVVGDTDHAGLVLAPGQRLERCADHRRAHDLPEGADMRQAGGAIASLEGDGPVFRLPGALHVLKAFEQCARLFEGPGLGCLGKLCKRAHNVSIRRIEFGRR